MAPPPTPPCESNPSPCLDLWKSCVPEQKEHLGLVLTHALPQTWDVISGSMMEQPQAAAYRGEHSPTNTGISSGCPVPQGTGSHSPHIESAHPLHTHAHCSLLCRCTHVCMLSLCTSTLDEQPHRAHSHSPCMCSLSAQTQCTLTPTPYTLFTYTHNPSAHPSIHPCPRDQSPPLLI